MSQALKEIFSPVLDGLGRLEAEQRDLEGKAAEIEDQAREKAGEVARAKRGLRVVGVIEPEPVKPKRRKKQKRSASPEAIEKGLVVLDTDWAQKPFSTAQFAKKTGLSKHVAYAVVEELRAGRRLRLIGRRPATAKAPAKAKFYTAIKGG